MPNERTPLKLAHEILSLSEDDTCRECDPDCMCSERKARRVAAALIEQSTPVEVYDDYTGNGKCSCASGVEVFKWNKYCSNCGRPITWK